MIPVSHGLSGFIVLFSLVQTGLVELSMVNMFMAVFFSVIPDVDGLWNSSLEDHHTSLLHAPTFWIILSSGLFISGLYSLGVLMLLSTLFHLFLDYLTALTTGVRFLYPFSNRDFYLFSLSQEPEGFNPSNPSGGQLKSFFQLYLDQKPVLVIEAVIVVLGVVSLLGL